MGIDHTSHISIIQTVYALGHVVLRATFLSYHIDKLIWKVTNHIQLKPGKCVYRKPEDFYFDNNVTDMKHVLSIAANVLNNLNVQGVCIPARRQGTRPNAFQASQNADPEIEQSQGYFFFS